MDTVATIGVETETLLDTTETPRLSWLCNQATPRPLASIFRPLAILFPRTATPLIAWFLLYQISHDNPTTLTLPTIFPFSLSEHPDNQETRVPSRDPRQHGDPRHHNAAGSDHNHGCRHGCPLTTSILSPQLEPNRPSHLCHCLADHNINACCAGQTAINFNICATAAI